MENSSYIALSRQMTLRNQLNVVANNIANANTPGYKGEKMIFREYLTQSSTKNLEEISFVQDIGLARNLTDGPLVTTGNAFDVAIGGPGYFVMETPTGERFTEVGHFQLDSDRQLVNSEGFPVMGVNGTISIPVNEGEVYITKDGIISTDLTANIAQLRVVNFENEQQMTRGAHGLYTSDEIPIDVDKPNIIQGSVEDSNVQPIIEMTRMMTILREYKSVQNFVKKEHERQEKAIQRLGRVS